MKQRSLRWAVRVGALTLVVLLLNSASAGLAQEKGTPPATLPAEQVAVWKKAGATVGWMRVRGYGYPKFLSLKNGVSSSMEPSRSK